ncbi:hypothetical protein CYY_003485 [Polysphondylium violaceum]|uniref:SPX domain-containing protein n=1 Tax=Polysphondylium violaceum TaxID=133409 RepID=A0A8J4V8M8_9MYCE|nr:hypothetical protein CYY_003485 [Polysphondylium violaceum]
MKFGKYLQRHQVPEWRKKYVFYKQFKKQIKAIKRSLNEDEFSVPSQHQQQQSSSNLQDSNMLNESMIQIQKERNTEREEKKFEAMLAEEFEKVNSFYLQQEDIFIKQFNDIRERLDTLPAGKDKESKRPAWYSKTGILHHHPSESRKSGSHSRTPSNGSGASSPLSDLTNSTNIRHRLKVAAASEPASPAQPIPNAFKVIAHATNAETYWSSKKLNVTKVRRALKRALEENYREIQVLKEYVSLNHTAFRKIFKKYDKILGRSRSVEGMRFVESQYFNSSKKLVVAETEIEDLYINVFKHGNRRDGMAKLRVPKEYHAPPHIVFSTGALTGASIVLFIFCIRYMIGFVSVFYFDSETPIDFLSIFMLFRFIGLPIILLWYFGILFYVCSGKKINLFLILGWDARSHITHYHILLLAASLTFLWTGALFLYIYIATHFSGRLPVLFPFLLIIIILSVVFCPFNIFFRQSRMWLITTFGRIFSAPFLPVKFKDFFFGDQLTSLSIVLSDMEYVFCYFVKDLWSGDDLCWRINPYVKPCLISIPPLLRALQSLRRYRDAKQRVHLLNFGKYSMSILSIVTSAIAHAQLTPDPGNFGLMALWYFTASISTIYSCAWDFLMDWGVLRLHSRNFLLRDHLYYRHKSVYYFAIVSNIIMRVSWAVNISFESYSSKTKELIVLITSIIEVTRRFQWNFFRLENEHLSNVGKFKAFELRIPETFSIAGKLSQMVLPDPIEEEKHEESTKLENQSSTTEDDNNQSSSTNSSPACENHQAINTPPSSPEDLVAANIVALDD